MQSFNRHRSFFFALIFLFLFLTLPLYHGKIFSLECKPGFTYESKEELEKIKTLCEQKVTELKNQANTLSSQIQFMDAQIYLTTLRIQATEQKIIDTEKEINLLSSKIDNLDNSLNDLSKLLLERIVTGYKSQSVSVFNLFLDSGNAPDFLNKIKYQKTVRDNNQKLLVQVQESKLNFEEQKKTREQKKTDLSTLQATLNKQKVDLDNQKVQKQKLLADTQNDEGTYQQLLLQAQRQLSAFKSFIQNAGVSSIIGENAFGNGSDGAYFSQRDARWANRLIGYSSETVVDVGCLLTSVSMILKKNGVDTNPVTIASNPNYYSLNTAQMRYRWQLNPWPNGLNSYQLSLSQVDEELQQGHYVIVGINHGGGCKAYSDHFVVLTKKEGSDYKMHDPARGPDLNFSSYYSQICWAETFK